MDVPYLYLPGTLMNMCILPCYILEMHKIMTVSLFQHILIKMFIARACKTKK
jgi:hypothetical protein